VNEVYTHHSVVTIGDTNLLQNMYFANYFKLAGTARELWLRQHVPEVQAFLSQGLVLITKNASCEFFHDFYLFDSVRLELWFEALKRSSIEVHFAFFHNETGKLHALGVQTIVIADATHKPCSIPQGFVDASLAFIKQEVGK
jgi:acyl-CoA thioesterase FadM